MKPWRAPLLVAVVVAVLAHIAFVHAYPTLLMRATLRQLGGGGERLHRWLAAPRVTPAARRIVRPAPEFAYSACVYDLSRGALRIRLPASPDYWSLSFYAGNSDNFLTLRDVDHRDGLELLLAAGEAAPAAALRAPDTRGVALIRRLATDDAGWQNVERLRKEDVCTLAAS
ncbi:DUF1254 domain-containing protein [Solimonas soli]|uniref:DUF1254 domain-containing protein n=1 Tax=Solimonas soli TaxID=413479 RepID=UPI00048A0340|nr:DUF1254 domain-containing protein [Solimonas soli]